MIVYDINGNGAISSHIHSIRKLKYTLHTEMGIAYRNMRVATL